MASNLISEPCFRLCLDVQQELDGRQDAPINLENNENATINFLTSAQNNSNNVVAEAVGQLAQKARPQTVAEGVAPTTVNLLYSAPDCDEADECTDASICDVTGSWDSYRRWVQFTINECAQKSGVIPIEQFRTVCENPGGALADEIQRASRSIKRSMNRIAIESLAASFGDYVNGTNSGTAPAVVPVVTVDQDGLMRPNRIAIAQFNTQYRRKQWRNGFQIIGGDSIAEHNDIAVSMGMTQLPYTYDNRLDDVLQGIFTDNLSNAITIPYGVFNFVEWYDNDLYLADPRLQTPTRSRTKLTIDGMTYDFDLYLDECNDVWKWRLRKKFDFFKIPAAAYCEGADDLILRWNTICGPADCGMLSASVPNGNGNGDNGNGNGNGGDNGGGEPNGEG